MLERFRAKWGPVRVKKTRQNKNLEPRFDSIETEKALEFPDMNFALEYIPLMEYTASDDLERRAH
jgi:hypothetical protein